MKINMTTRLIAIFLTPIFCLMVLTDASANRDCDEKQAKLDAVCEEAREVKLAPMREEFVEECVTEGQQRDRESCVDFYADFGAQSGNRAPLFFDLPECVEAFEFQNSQRQR
jgi:hypothetical protein